MHVSIVSIVFMVFSALAAIGAPIGVFIVLHKKYKTPVLPMVVGMGAFIVFVLILEQAVHAFVFARYNLRENLFLYTVYGTLMAGVFEETARLLSFSVLKRKYKGVGVGLSYGLGHGGAEAILIVGIAMIVNIVLSIVINSSSGSVLDNLPAAIQGGTLEQLNASIQALTTTAPYFFLFGGIERIFAVAIQVALSIVVFYAVSKKLWLYPLAILIHALLDVPAALMQLGVIKSIFLVEGLTGLSAVLLLLFARYLHKNFGSDCNSFDTGAL
ncbi:MAG: YhfC family intramembrane metalloprotease [Spirochaetaceae bacterium]|nr:YhfC family intramembrane metalloprotease [Spirochaetaceae bacterium]